MAARKRTPSRPSRKAAGGARRTAKTALPDVIYAQASPRSAGGVSMFDAQEQIKEDTVTSFFADDAVTETAAARLAAAGFEVLQITPLTINIVGPPSAYENAFNAQLFAEERPVIKELAKETTAEFIDSERTQMPGLISTLNTPFADVLEGIAIEEPRYFMAPPSSFAPLKEYWHLRVPGDVSLAANADKAHRAGITGRGVRIAMVDSGWYKHPFFVNRGYRAAPVVLGPGAANPLVDESGHGTGESANIFAVAPDIELLPVKMNFVNTIGAFNAAVGLRPDIITCSWGSSRQVPPLSAADQALAAAIAAAVANGITVIFAAGNGHWGFPGQHPDVISAGGVFMDVDETLRASDYASGFASNIYPGRRVPDLSGLVGMQPRAIYIMLPVEPDDQIDRSLAGGTHPNADETTRTDGWAAFSGTSAAAPQLAGAAALIRQACPALRPAEIRDILMKTARDVTAGTCSPGTGGNAAGPGFDLATGAGLVDAHKAAMVAKVRCLGPIVPPVTPLPPVGPVPPRVPPTPPIPPVRPAPPVLPPIRPPVQPPVQPPVIPPVRPPIRPPIEPPVLPPVRPPIRPPVEPIRPIVPAESLEGVPEAAPPESRGPTRAGRAPAEGGPSAPQALSPEDVRALEDMIISSDIELES